MSGSHVSRLQGQTYLVCGQVAQARSQQAREPEIPDLLEQAERWYRNAIEVLQESRGDVAQAFQLLAQLLEHSNREEQALFFWRQAYARASEA